jgi:hypothetical protein
VYSRFAVVTPMRAPSRGARLDHGQFGGALHSACSGLSDVGADRPFAGVALNKTRSASAKPAARQAPRGPTHVQHAAVENVSRSFHAYREPRQSTRGAGLDRDQFGGALHSACSGLSDVGADRPFAGVALNKTRRPGTDARSTRCG